ncbi:MAG: hypothetical protein R3B94_15860 [Hyphomonas sp.]
MAEPWWKLNPETKAVVAEALRRHAPRMRLVEETDALVARGPFDVGHDGQLLGRFLIEIAFDPETAEAAHRVTETAGRIPRTLDRHINTDGTCCLAVYGEWELTSPDLSLGAFLSGPVRHFFLSQLHFEGHGVRPFDQRAHGLPGMIESYAEMLGVENNEDAVVDTLALLLRSEMKGHWRCPCGSGARLRNCCRGRFAVLKEKWSLAGVQRLMGNYLKVKRSLAPNTIEPQFSKHG